jgi:hypothetical protein
MLLGVFPMCLALIVILYTLPVQSSRVAIEFEPESATEAFIKASADYDAIWKAEGIRTIEAMESVTGITFEERRIKAIVYEGVSFSGGGDRPMRLRASYPPDVKKGTLVHELLHRMLSRVKPTNEIDEHRKLFLVLYDIWVVLYGKDFADQNVAVESRRKGLYDYESAWKWALTMSAEERASKFKALRAAAPSPAVPKLRGAITRTAETSSSPSRGQPVSSEKLASRIRPGRNQAARPPNLTFPPSPSFP